jgi:hypothetical protein
MDFDNSRKSQTFYLIPLYAYRLQERIVSINESISIEPAHGSGQSECVDRLACRY